MSFTEKKLDGNVLYSGKILTLTLDTVVLDDGSRAQREIVRHRGGAAVLYIEDGKVLLVRQFRYAYGKEIYEIPAGLINCGEDPSSAAARELEEEAGLKAEVVHYLDLYPSPGYTSELIRIYYATNATITQQKLDDGEFLNVEFVPLEKVLSMIESGEICDAKTIAAVYKYISEIKKEGR